MKLGIIFGLPPIVVPKRELVNADLGVPRKVVQLQ